MTCCIGKARIYYKEPIGFNLIYSGSANGSVSALERLTSQCELDNIGQEGITYTAHFNIQYKFYDYYNEVIYSPVDFTWTTTGIAPVNVYVEIRHPGQKPSADCDAIVVEWANKTENVPLPGGNWVCSKVQNFSYYLENQNKYRFKVIGTETGTIYREIGGLDECPAVDNVGCVMGEEKHVDVSMGDIFKPFDPIFSPLLPDCILSVDLFDSVQVFKRKVAIPRPLDMPIINLKKLEGCPPTYRVVCCPDGDCDPKERCPPDTDCSLDCGDFVCCYKNGKVIKTVRK